MKNFCYLIVGLIYSQGVWAQVDVSKPAELPKTSSESSHLTLRDILKYRPTDNVQSKDSGQNIPVENRRLSAQQLAELRAQLQLLSRESR